MKTPQEPETPPVPEIHQEPETPQVPETHQEPEMPQEPETTQAPQEPETTQESETPQQVTPLRPLSYKDVSICSQSGKILLKRTDELLSLTDFNQNEAYRTFCITDDSRNITPQCVYLHNNCIYVIDSIDDTVIYRLNCAKDPWLCDRITGRRHDDQNGEYRSVVKFLQLAVHADKNQLIATFTSPAVGGLRELHAGVMILDLKEDDEDKSNHVQRGYVTHNQRRMNNVCMSPTGGPITIDDSGKRRFYLMDGKHKYDARTLIDNGNPAGAPRSITSAIVGNVRRRNLPVGCPAQVLTTFKSCIRLDFIKSEANQKCFTQRYDKEKPDHVDLTVNSADIEASVAVVPVRTAVAAAIHATVADPVVAAAAAAAAVAAAIPPIVAAAHAAATKVSFTPASYDSFGRWIVTSSGSSLIFWDARKVDAAYNLAITDAVDEQTLIERVNNPAFYKVYCGDPSRNIARVAFANPNAPGLPSAPTPVMPTIEKKVLNPAPKPNAKTVNTVGSITAGKLRLYVCYTNRTHQVVCVCNLLNMMRNQSNTICRCSP